MRAIRILLRLAQQEADEQRAALAEAIREREVAQRLLASHTETIAQERAALAGDIEAWRDWAAWAALSERQAKDIAAAVGHAETHEEEVRTALREALVALKRLELMQEAADQADRRAAGRRAEAAAEEAELRRPREMQEPATGHRPGDLPGRASAGSAPRPARFP